MTRRERERGLPGGLRVNLGFASLPVPEKPTDSAAAWHSMLPLDGPVVPEV